MTTDLHTHTTASDGALEPAALLARAREHGVSRLAITDHDTVAGFDRLDIPAGLSVVTGIELSTYWRNIGVHVVGLAIDPASAVLSRGIARQQSARQERAARIADRLAKKGIPDALPGVTRLANGGPVARPHFARYLVDSGYVRDEREAFRKYLGAGKAGDVRHLWATLDEVIGWVRDAGGVAVLAHPAHYRLTATKLRALLADFRAAGGRGLEVVSGHQDCAVTARFAQFATDFELCASQGSDFHAPGRPWAELGRIPALPRACRPVWSLWE